MNEWTKTGVFGGLALVVVVVAVISKPRIENVALHEMEGKLLFADKFDEMSGIQTFIILPASMLSGVFFINESLNPFFQTIMQFNPFWYIIDGMRFSFLGVVDGSIVIGLWYLSGLAVVTWLIALLLYSRGYKIKK